MSSTRSSKPTKDKPGKDKEEKEETPKPKGGGKQTNLDSVVLQLNKDSGISELIGYMNTINQKLNQLVSKDYLDKCLQKIITEECVQEKLDSLKKDITDQFKTELETASEQISNFKATLDNQDAEIVTLKNQISDMQTTLDQNKEETKNLRKKNQELRESLDQRETVLKKQDKDINDLEQYTRSNSIRIYGMRDDDRTESAEATASAVVKLIQNKLGLNIQVSDIDIAHRIGSFQPDGNRPVICKFCSRNKKISIMRARRKLKGSGIVIREDLTTRNAKLLEEVSKREVVDKAWSDGGKIICILHSGRKIKVDVSSDLDRALR